MSEYTTNARHAAKLHNSDTQLLNRRAASRYTTLEMSEYTTNERHDAKLHNSDTHTHSQTKVTLPTTGMHSNTKSKSCWTSRSLAGRQEPGRWRSQRRTRQIRRRHRQDMVPVRRLRPGLRDSGSDPRQRQHDLRRRRRQYHRQDA